ncbi:hypothetical protein A2880_03400 [Candidatus Peribacteria bacterium RIFCSPHIGHO2_01_FULL_49_38]|nr:MAG: hypothetical protein A2880_03400 [Candidatus Peribacteria bacterium RIFCSPHIGHO2_01_FULL_49_38]
MKQVKEVLVSPYRGSEQTYEMVKDQIEARWGEACAEEFDPHTDAMPFSSWLSQGYAVKKGQKALKSITFVEVKDENDKVVRKIRRTVNLFHRKQVEKMS